MATLHYLQLWLYSTCSLSASRIKFTA